MNLHVLIAVSLLAVPTPAAQQVTEIINASGDGAGNTLSQPRGITATAAGDVYVTSIFPAAVFKVSKDGSVEQVFDASGDGMGNTAQTPMRVASSSSGDVYVTCNASENVFEIKPSGRVAEILDDQGAGPGQRLDGPFTVHVDAASNVLVAGKSSDNVFRVAPDGSITELINESGDGNGNRLVSPSGIASDSGGNAYVSSASTAVVFRISLSGTISVVLDGTGDGMGNALFVPRGIVVDGSGSLFVASEGTDLVFKITQSGLISIVLDASGDGQTPLSRPRELAVDTVGNLYVLSRSDNTLFRVTPTGDVTMVLDETSNGAGISVMEMFDVAVDHAGHVYVVGNMSCNAVKLCSEYPIGTNYCSTSPNSVGPGATISATGDLSVISRCLALHVESAPHDISGLFYFGTAASPVAPFGEGLRCVGGATTRVHPFARTGPANGNPPGAVSLVFDFERPYGTALLASPQTIYCQFWYRDPTGGPAGFNLSDAVQVDLVQ